MNVLDYYWTRFDELDFGHRLHFATRLFNYCHDETAERKLEDMRAEYVTCNLDEVLQEFYERQIDSGSRFFELRRAAYEKYPKLQFVDLALSRLFRLKDTFGIDQMGMLQNYISHEELEKILRTLADDDESIAALSTIAVTTLIMGSRYLYEDTRLVDYEQILGIGQNYDTTGQLALSQLFYLFTHCPIYESELYRKTIPKKNEAVFWEMLCKLDEAVATRTSEISLDNKLEFLVCCELCGYEAKSRERIFEECTSSIKSTAEPFLVDKNNAFSKTTSSALAGSEHRNVLFVMAQRKYSPWAGIIR